MRYAAWGGLAALVIGAFVLYHMSAVVPGHVEDGRLVYPAAALDDEVTTITLRDYGLNASWGQTYVFIVAVDGDEGYRALSSTSPSQGCSLTHGRRVGDFTFYDSCHSRIDPETRQYSMVYGRTGEPIRAPAEIQGMFIHDLSVRNGELLISPTRSSWYPVE